MTISIDDFDYISAMLRKRSGLVLNRDKMYLLESRLNPVARRYRLANLEALVAELRKGSNIRLIDDVVESMTTNESFFFRDIRPFDQFRDNVLPALLDARRSSRKIRIWCAACSSGQEPYSLAMILSEAAEQLRGWKVEIVATDLSRAMLAKARAGIYSQFEVQRGLPVRLLVKYFHQDGDKWTIAPELRAMVTFREYNLLDDLRILGRFDVIYCRNVLIYFDQETKSVVLGRVASILEEDGYLFLGGAETVLGVSDAFAPVSGLRGVHGRSLIAEGKLRATG